MGDTLQPSPAPLEVMGCPCGRTEHASSTGTEVAAPASHCSSSSGLRAADTILSSQASSTIQTTAGITAVPLHCTGVCPLLASLAGVFPQGSTLLRRGSDTAMPSGTARPRAVADFLALQLTLFNEDVN